MLRAVQPEGPYRLLGHSFGGLVAWRIATLIEQAGGVISELVLLDTAFPGLEADRGLDPFLAMLPERARRVAESNIAIANAARPAQRVSRLTYMRADGDGRDAARETRWLALADMPEALEPVACGHYAMLDGDGLDQVLRRLQASMVNSGFTPGS